MNTKNPTTILDEREALIAEAMVDLLPALRSVNPIYYAEFLEQGRHPEIDGFVNLVLTSCYDPSAFMFACTGRIERNCDKVSAVKLDFELVQNGVFAFFRVNIFADFPTVEIHHMSFETDISDPHINTDHLRKTLELVRF